MKHICYRRWCYIKQKSKCWPLTVNQRNIVRVSSEVFPNKRVSLPNEVSVTGVHDEPSISITSLIQYFINDQCISAFNVRYLRQFGVWTVVVHRFVGLDWWNCIREIIEIDGASWTPSTDTTFGGEMRLFGKTSLETHTLFDLGHELRSKWWTSRKCLETLTDWPQPISI